MDLQSLNTSFSMSGEGELKAWASLKMMYVAMAAFSTLFVDLSYVLPVKKKI